MRNADEVARAIAKAIMDRIEIDRCVHLSSVEDEVRKHLGGLQMFERERQRTTAEFTPVCPGDLPQTEG